MSSYVKPQVLVFQEFSIVPTEITEPLRAHITGPNAVLHRYSVPSEKSASMLGSYDRLHDTTFAWPNRTAGGLVDDMYTKVYIDNALLLYYNTAVDATPYSCGSLHVYSPDDRSENNIIRSHNLSFKSNGALYPRSAVFNDRDVKLGDTVHVTYVAPGDCTVTDLWSTITGFASDKVNSRIQPAHADGHNQPTVGTLATTVTKLAGLDAEVPTVTAVGTGYAGLAAGHVSEEYTFEVVRSSVVGCDAARIRVVSASGSDDVAEATPADNAVNIGTRGLHVTFDDQNKLKIGQKWRVTVAQVYTAVAATANGNGASLDGADYVGNGTTTGYTGEQNDIYIIECTKGGLWAALPEITVYTAKGLDYSAPIEISASGDLYAIGTKGLKVSFDQIGLLKGDKWYITAVAAQSGDVHEIRLKDDLPPAMRGQSCHLEMEMYIKDDIQLSKNRLGFAPLTNYYTEATQLVLQAGAVAYQPTWTAGGVEQPLSVYSGDVFVEYREWVTAMTDTVNSAQTAADLDLIPGQLDQDNPLKWGVYKALANANGTVVKYTAVANPDSLDSWVNVLERIKGRDDIYNLVPMTFDRAVQDLWAAQIASESNEIADNWKAGFVAIKSRPVAQLVGEGVTIGGVLGNVVDGSVVATLSDNPSATGTQYTKLQVTSGNGYFITNDVQPGDIVRYGYTVDSFGDTQYEEYVVDSVLSESTLLLTSGGDAAVTVAQRVEIYHNRNRNEVASDLAMQAGSFGTRRICAVWPDQVGEAGVSQPGYYLAAALAGLASGVVPQQPLTNVEVVGFDDYSRSYKYFNETQLNQLAEAGVWIVTQDNTGTAYSRHALTTDMLDLNRREEMIRRNVDSLSYLFLRRLRPYIGRTNATEGMLRLLRTQLEALLRTLSSNGNTLEIGSQLTDGSITTLRIHPLLKDRVEIVLALSVPAPLNNIELHLVV